MHRLRGVGALRTLAALAALASTLSTAPAASAQTTTTGSSTTGTSSTVTAPAVAAKAEILVDVDTGKVLFQSNAHDPLPPASLTKTLTAMIAADWLPADAEVPVTAVDANVYPDRVGMKSGQLWPLDVTLHALITDSANDAAYALAEDVGGSLAGFAGVMQTAARQIGMSDNPVLEDPAGLDGSIGFAGGNRMSAWDLAIAGRDMMANPELAAIAAQKTYDFKGPDGILYHLLSRNYHFLATYPGAVGVKTGFTDLAGYCDMEEAQRGGRHMLAVVLASTNPDAVAGALISQGFDVPVAAESLDPSLPPVQQPQSVRPPPPPSQPAAPTTSAPAALRSAVKRTSGSSLGDSLEGAGIVIGIVLLTWRWRTRKRSRPSR